MKAGWRKGHVGGAHEGGLGPAGHRREPDGRPLHGAEALDGVLGHRDACGRGGSSWPGAATTTTGPSTVLARTAAAR